MRLRQRSLARLLAAAPVLAACSGSEPEAPLRSAVLLTLDTTNAGALDVYGADRDATPNLARLASQSVIYDNARTVAPVTVPSHSSMLTGLYPPRHRVRDNGFLPLPSSAETLAERAQGAGYLTAAFVSGRVLAPTYGLHQGFDVYSSPSLADEGVAHPGEFTAAETAAKAIDWLDARPAERPFFLWVHCFDAHTPYDPPPEFRARFPDRVYLAEVAAMDAALGPLIRRLEREPDWEQMTVVVVADHGESLGRHGEAEHGIFAYEATIHVPFFVRLPGRARAGERAPDVVSVVDVFPTLLEGMGLPPVAGVDGLSLGPDAVIPPDRGVYFEAYHGYFNYGWGALVGWADGSRKYIHSSSPELFDLRGDPGEQRNLYDPALPAVSRARAAIARLHEAPTLTREEVEQLVASAEDLTALGYAAAAGAEADADLPDPLDDDAASDRPNPRTRLGEHERVWSAVAMAGIGRQQEAIARLRDVVAENPRNVFALDKLAGLLLRSDRPAEAIEAFERMVAQGCERPGVRQGLAVAHALLGQRGRAFEQAALYEALCPPGDPGPAALRAALEARLSGR